MCIYIHLRHPDLCVLCATVIGACDVGTTQDVLHMSAWEKGVALFDDALEI